MRYISLIGIGLAAMEGIEKNKKKGDIFWIKVDSSGAMGSAKKISVYSLSVDYYDSGQQIVVDSSGNSYVVWESNNGGWGDQFDQQICWVKLDSSGNSGRVQKISSRQYSKHFDRNPRICIESGNSYVTWGGDDESGNDQIYFTASQTDSRALLRLVGMTLLALAVMAAIIQCLQELVHHV